MRSTLATQTVFRYNDDPKNDQVMNDLVGTMPRHIVGDFVNRKGETLEGSPSSFMSAPTKDPDTIPLHRCLLDR